jgi:hypothetical protein
LSALGRLPFGAALVLVASVGVLALLIGALLGFSYYSLFTLVLPSALAGLYLHEYAQRPYVPTPRPAPISIATPHDPVPEEPTHPPGLDAIKLTLFDEEPPVAEGPGEETSMQHGPSAGD